MNVAVFTLTRDRLEYTQRAFGSLREKAGYPFWHFVFDNGSRDGTLDWLRSEYRAISRIGYYETLNIAASAENLGISKASNQRLHRILADGFDLVIKFDNDAEVLSPDIIQHFVNIYSDPEAQKWVLGPRCHGLNNQPRRNPPVTIGGYEVSRTAIVGGIFKVAPVAMLREFMADGGFDENLPLARGQDDFFAEWRRQKGYFSGYVDSLHVAHIDGTDGQARKYPHYFERKHIEEKMGNG